MRFSTLRKFLLVLILCGLSFRLSPSQGNDNPALLETRRATLTAYVLKEDIEILKTYEYKIDDEINMSSVHLPDIAAGILEKRVAQVEAMVKELLSKKPDFSVDETIETDPEKMDFCATADELRERWRKALKYQVLYRYLSMLEDEGKAASTGTDNSKTEKKQPEDILESARKKILKNNETAFARMRQENPRERFDRFFESFARAFDPHTDFMPPVDKEDFDIGMKGSLEGIGATLKEEEGYVKIVSIVPGGPAYRQGELQPEDVILKVREGDNEPVDITDLKLRDAIKLIRGPKGTSVTLTVKRPSGVLNNITIIRDVVQLEDGFAKGMVLQDEKTGKSFGYIKIPTFYRDFEGTRFGGSGRNVTHDVKNEMNKLRLREISGLILDLRNNGGGALTDAVKIAGLFIKSGPIVQVKDSNEKVSTMYDDDPDIIYSGPMTVLVNKFSASASEILAAALQDYDRAVIMGGEHTHGKGTVQTIVDLNDEVPFPNMEHLKPIGALRITTQKFYRITGESTQYRGVTPDIILPDKFTGLKSGEQHLDYALPWDKIKPSSYTKWSGPVFDLTELKSKSQKRVKSMQDFIDLENYSKRVTEEQKKTIRSLNIETAKKEIEESKKMRDKTDKGHGMNHGADKKGASGRLSEEEKKEIWQKGVREDAYVREAESVLSDIINVGNVATVH